MEKQISFRVFWKRGKIEINGKGGSYGPEILTLYKMLNNKIKPKKIVYKFKNKDYLGAEN